MDNLNDLKAIWLSAKTDSLPDSAEMVRIIRQFRNQKLKKLVMLISVAVLAVVFMMVAYTLYDSKMLVTRIGEVCLILSALILIATNINSLIRFKKLNDCSNADFLKFLEKTRTRQLFYHHKTQMVCMILYSAGLLLYLYELVYIKPMVCIAAYTLTILFLAYFWLIERPRKFKKQAVRMNEMIAKTASLAEQLNTL